MKDKLNSTEELLVGSWTLDAGSMVADELCDRIHRLVRGCLEEVCVDPDGWRALYLNPEDRALWVLSYPQSHMHGGGPPELRKVSLPHAEKQFGVSLGGHCQR